MNSLIKLFIAAAGVCMFSCENILEEEPVSSVSYGYYDTQAGIESGVIAAYDALRQRYEFDSERNASFHLLGTDTYMHGRDTEAQEELDRYEASLNAGWEQLYIRLWQPYYEAINITNAIAGAIQEIDNGMDEDLKAVRLGEIRFLRAWYYFLLVQQFGDIPLKTSAELEARTDFSRAPVAEVYKFIISDLRFAIDNLPLSQDDYGRATKGAAQHLLSKVYLTRGSAVTRQRGQQPTDIDSAAWYADQVIFSGAYALLPDFAELWDINNQENSEVIFAVQFSENQLLNNNEGNSMHLYFGMTYDLKPGMKRDIANGRPWNRLRPTDFTIRQLFDPKIDSRFHKTFQSVWFSNNPDNLPVWEAAGGFAPEPGLAGKPKFGVGDTAIWVTSEVYPDNTNFDSLYASRPYYYMPVNRQGLADFFVNVKYLDPTRPGINDVNGQRDGTLFRLGETFLIAAEAYGRMGDFATAAERLNMVRQRAAYKEGELKDVAYWKVYGGSYADRFKSTEAKMLVTPGELAAKASFLDFILDERARELSGELWRWDDLVRTEKLVERARKYNSYAAPNIREYHVLRPIPQNFIDRIDPKRPVEEVQNEGYY